MDPASPSPDISQLASLLADPGRSRMLLALMGGQALTAGELARLGGLSAQAASHHLTLLQARHVLEVVTQGRHRYYRLATVELAYAIEALQVASSGLGPAQAFRPKAPDNLRVARTCYRHLAGQLGVALYLAMQQNGVITTTPQGHLSITPQGTHWLQRVLQLNLPDAGRRPLFRPCLDWSERRPHLAGKGAELLLDALLQAGWLQAGRGRQLLLTITGRRQLQQQLPGIALPEVMT